MDGACFSAAMVCLIMSPVWDAVSRTSNSPAFSAMEIRRFSSRARTRAISVSIPVSRVSVSGALRCLRSGDVKTLLPPGQHSAAVATSELCLESGGNYSMPSPSGSLFDFVML